MRLEDLKHVFKSSNLSDVESKGYIVHLLNKFEVALTWDNRTLLIPSLLPTEDDIYTPPVRVKVEFIVFTFKVIFFFLLFLLKYGICL